MTILLICGILCILGAAVLAVVAFLPGGLPDMHQKPEAKPAAGGGYYVLDVEGMDTDEQVAAVENALAQFQTLTSEIDPEEGSVVIRCKGYPEQSMLDAIKQAVEETGCIVRDME